MVRAPLVRDTAPQVRLSAFGLVAASPLAHRPGSGEVASRSVFQMAAMILGVGHQALGVRREPGWTTLFRVLLTAPAGAHPLLVQSGVARRRVGRL